jgi:HlyD family secretion protein
MRSGEGMSMARIGKLVIIVALLALAAGAFWFAPWSKAGQPSVLGVVRATQIRVVPEVGGQLATIKVRKGDHVAAGDVVAELSAIELTASVEQAKAALASAVAERDHVYAGVRAEQIAVLVDEIAKDKSRLAYEQAELERASYLAARDFASQQVLDEATSKVTQAGAALAEAEANHQAAVAGATREERTIADAQVGAAQSALAVLEQRLAKTMLRTPVDGTVSVVVGEIGEAVRPGQPVLAIEESGKPWLSFNLREDAFNGITVGTAVEVARPDDSNAVPATVTELVPIGAFATWQSERTVGDHDRNTLRLRLDLTGDTTGFEPGMTVRLVR